MAISGKGFVRIPWRADGTHRQEWRNRLRPVPINFAPKSVRPAARALRATITIVHAVSNVRTVPSPALSHPWRGKRLSPLENRSDDFRMVS